ncbi:MAG: DUF1566 domain-containing protein [Prevotella sp.]|nr:DUF1566 domain-containing protein [Prevotella sp.]
MRKLNRLTMTLALLITAVGGAWAQSSLNVVELKAPAEWETDESNLTPADLPGFYTSTKAEAKAWKGAPTDGAAMLIYAFEGDDAHYVYFDNGTPEDKDYKFTFTKASVLFMTKIYYTVEPADPTEWLLTPDADKKVWTLYKMPASNVELQVEYFAESNLFLSKDALADKTNIAVKAGDLGVQFGDDGKSANTVTEGTPMTVTYNGTKKLLGMKVEKKAAAPSLNITSPSVGQVIGSDGKNYVSGTLPTGVTAVAKICYVSGSNGLALALTDEGQMNWSTAQTTCAAHTPAFTGGTWKLASKDEWSNMISAAGSYDDLRDGFSSVGGTNMQSGVYWSSTERDSGDSQAWVYFFNFIHDWGFGDKAIDNHVRACLEF